MKKIIKKFNSFMTSITLKYMLLNIWAKILLLPLWCIFILLMNVLALLVMVIYYVPKYKSKAFEQSVMDSIRDSFDINTEKETI